MRLLYYYPLDACSRIVRLLMSEKMLDFKLQYEFPWKLSEQLQQRYYYSTLPMLTDNNGTTVAGVSAIMEYIEEAYPDPHIFGYTAKQRAEARQIAYWFISEFQYGVVLPIVQEKVSKRFLSKNSSAPNPGVIRNAIYNISPFLDRMVWLLDRRSWLAGRDFSIADISASSFISVLDYLGILKWNNYNTVLLSWYVRIKSRRSFQPLLTDIISTIPPSRNYTKLDY